MWINIDCQWRAVWNTNLQGRCKGRKLSSLYLQIFIVKKQHLAYSFIVQAESLSGSRCLSNLRFSTDTLHLLKHFKSCSYSAQHGMDVESKYKKRALPKANGNWTAKALIIWQWVKVLSYSCKTTKFNWNPKMCSNRIMCGKFRMPFFLNFFVSFKVGWKWVEINAGPQRCCVRCACLIQAFYKHIPPQETYTYTLLYCTSPHVQQHSSINSKSKTAKYT